MVWLMGKDEIEVDMPEEWGGVVPTEVFVNEAKRIVEEAQKRDLVIRLIGGMAIRLHSEEFDELGQKLSRLEGEQEFTDLDFMTYRKYQKKKMPKFFEEYGEQFYDGKPFIKRRTTISSATTKRHIFYHPKGWFFIDVFYGILKMNHDIVFKKRLEIDPLTISVSDLLLEKLQICEVFSDKDLKDSILLIRAHDIKEEEGHCINAKYIAELLAGDWGFYYSVTENLKGIKELAPGIETLSTTDLNDVTSKIDQLLEIIDAEPKGFRWKARAKIGTRKQWYRPVEHSGTVGDMGIWNLREGKEDTEN